MEMEGDRGASFCVAKSWRKFDSPKSKIEVQLAEERKKIAEKENLTRFLVTAMFADS